MGSAFRNGVEAGLNEFRGVNTALSSVTLGTDPYGFTEVVNTANRIPDIASRFRSEFSRMGENLQDERKSWSETQKQRLLNGCDGMRTQGENLKTRANEALEAAKQAKDLRDAASSDESKKSQLEQAEQHLREYSDKLRDQINVVRSGLNEFYDTLRDVNNQFKTAVALAKSGADNSQAPAEQVLNEIRSLEDQVNTKIAEEKNFFSQRESYTRSYMDLTAKIDEKMRAEQDADRAVAEGAKKNPPISASDLKSLEQSSASARQARESAETDRTQYWNQTLSPADKTYWDKVSETAPMKKKLSELKQQRDTLLDGWNKAKLALAEFALEYEEPSL